MMSSRRLFVAVSILFLTGGCADAQGQAVAPSGMARTIDGDTLELNGERVRIWGVDAPESAQLCERGGQTYRCGLIAVEALSDWIGRRAVVCVEVERDRYDRSVARCSVEGNDIGGWLVSHGHALDYRQHSGGAYAGDEARARQAGLGVHAGSFEAPWDWRRTRRAVATEQAPPDDRCVIKGNINAKGGRIFHMPGMRSYVNTRINVAAGERWFCSEADARAAGWRRSGE